MTALEQRRVAALRYIVENCNYHDIRSKELSEYYILKEDGIIFKEMVIKEIKNPGSRALLALGFNLAHGTNSEINDDTKEDWESNVPFDLGSIMKAIGTDNWHIAINSIRIAYDFEYEYMGYTEVNLQI